MFNALFVPADPYRPASKLIVENLSDPRVRELLGDLPDGPAIYDRDMAIFNTEAARFKSSPLNERATAWVREQSHAKPNFRRTKESDFFLQGDALFVGCVREMTEDGPDYVFTDVPDRASAYVLSLETGEVVEAQRARIGRMLAERGPQSRRAKRTSDQRRGGPSRGRGTGIGREGLGR